MIVAWFVYEGIGTPGFRLNKDRVLYLTEVESIVKFDKERLHAVVKGGKGFNMDYTICAGVFDTWDNLHITYPDAEMYTEKPRI